MSNDSSSSVEPYSQDWQMLLVIQLTTLGILGCICTASARYLFADGSLFFLDVLNNCRVTSFSPGRYFAHWVTQFPLVLLLNVFECRDIRLAGTIYGATLFLTPVAALWLTAWAAKKAPPYYLAFPMLSQSILCLTTSFVTFSEIFPATWLFWCLLYLMMFSERLTIDRCLLLVVLGVLAIRSYESYLFLAWPLIFVAYRRGLAAWNAERRDEAAICGACGALFFAAFAVAAYSTVFPDDTGNRANFRNSLIDHLDYWPVRFSLVIMASVVVQLFWKRPWGFFYCLAVALLGLIVVLRPTLEPFDFNQPWYFQYSSRVQALYLPLLLGGLVAVNPLILQKDSMYSQNRQLGLWRMVALTCAVSFAFQFTATQRWNDYQAKLMNELAKTRGIIAFADAGDRSTEFDWGWAMPPLSIAMSAINQGAVKTIICPERPEDTEIYDPWNAERFSRLIEFGVTMDYKEHLPEAPQTEGEAMTPEEPAPQQPVETGN